MEIQLSLQYITDEPLIQKAFYDLRASQSGFSNTTYS